MNKVFNSSGEIPLVEYTQYREQDDEEEGDKEIQKNAWG